MPTIELDADELEYTPDGLRLREPLELPTGAHYRIVVRRPRRLKAVPASLGGFGINSSFPGPAVLALLLRPSFEDIFSHLADQKSDSVYQVFGHASTDGDLASNKLLSERRAKVVLAMLTGDVDVVQQIARDEAWSTQQHQVMLRVLRCDPGAIDGEDGPVTPDALGSCPPRHRAGGMGTAGGLRSA